MNPLKNLGIDDLHSGLSTGADWLESDGPLNESVSPIDGKPIAKIRIFAIGFPSMGLTDSFKGPSLSSQSAPVLRPEWRSSMPRFFSGFMFFYL